MDKYLTKLVAAGKTHPDIVKSNKENNNSDVEVLEEKKMTKKYETKNCKVMLTRLNSKEKNKKTDDENKMDVDVEEHKTPEIKPENDEASGDEVNTTEIVTKKVQRRSLANKDPSTPVGNNSRPAMTSLSSSKKKKTEAEKQLANQIRLENLKKKEEEEQKKKEARLKQEEERRRRKAEEEERKAERLKLEEERRKRKAEEEERKAENRRKMEELRQKREEEKLKREEEKIKQMEEKLEKEKEAEKQRLEKLEKERIKNEEKRLKEEEKAKEEEEKRRKADLVKNKFAQFFVKVDAPKTAETDKENQKMGRFMSFQLKVNMTQAPINRRTDIQDFEEFKRKMDDTLTKCSESDSKPNYLKEILANPKLIRRVKTCCRKSKKSKLIKISEESNINQEEESVMSIEEIKSSLETDIIPEVEEVKTRVKYIHFDKTECKRPPYYGTWRKKSKKVGPRNPFAMDEKLIDYEVDSADEWEDIVDAESIGDSDKDEEEERLKDADDEEDDGFLVPHGHLSDDELEEDERMMNPEQRKLREAAKTEQWETERKKSIKNIIPKCYFTEDYWNDRNPSLDTAKHTKHLNHLERLRMKPFMQDLSPSLFPMYILTDQQIEHDKQVKQANDEAAKKAKAAAAAAAKEALKEEAAANASPTTTTPKGKLKKKNSENGQNNSPLIANGSNTPVATGSASILKFVSKMSNKNIVLKPANAQETTDTDKPEVVMVTKPPLSMNNQKTGTPISKRRSLLAGSPAVQTTPQSSPLVHNNTTAEKRANDFSGENVVKRMKLNDEVNTESGANTPTIKALFKNSPCRKNLNSSISNSPIQSPAIKKHVLGPAKRNSIDGIASRLLAEKVETPTASSDSSNSQMDAEPSVVVKGKENSCITLE